jgi:dTMP kinase
VTLEGRVGCGKSTQLRLLKTWLEEQGKIVTATRQPGGTAIGDSIRTLLLDSRTKNLSPLAELGLMFSDRAQSIAQVIRPALERGHIVLSDRFTDSTEAYQGGGRELGSKIVLDLHASICGGLTPDLTLLLLPDLDLSLNRARQRNRRIVRSKGSNENRFESENEGFYVRVLAKYREIAAREPARVAVIDGDASIDEVHRRIRKAVETRLPLPKPLQAAEKRAEATNEAQEDVV